MSQTADGVTGDRELGLKNLTSGNGPSISFSMIDWAVDDFAPSVVFAAATHRRLGFIIRIKRAA